MADLAYVLRRLPSQSDPALLAGEDIGDDAAVYRLTDDLALVQTVDYFTPIVDDPYLFGQIAAANALSDVYAVGGQPLTALNIAGFPVDTLPADILAEILRGGADKAREAGVSIVGGHTVEDSEPKYGLAVTGTVHPDAFFSGRGALPGDVLVLTKPLGTGVLSTALKRRSVSSTHLAQAVRWMAALNRDASIAMRAARAHASTDITGFGLLGHLAELCRSSEVAADIEANRVPFLPGALEYARAGYTPGGTRKNLSAVSGVVRSDPEIDGAIIELLADAQTSGGLLLALSPDAVSTFRRIAGTHCLSAVIGEITNGTRGTICITARKNVNS